MISTRCISSLARSLIKQHKLCDSFYVVDTAQIEHNVMKWRYHLPDVDMYYAVKCNPDSKVLEILSKHQTGFDCASKNEITRVLNLNTPPTRIIFAHPCKKEIDIAFARSCGVKLTTFDSLSELDKIRRIYPDIGCLLRLKVDNPSARVPLGIKYGATMDETVHLLKSAKDMNIDVKGVSFHVGSASEDPSVYDMAIKNALCVIGIGESFGFDMNIIDIGGGFTEETFEPTAQVIKAAISSIKDKKQIHFLAEPGRFIVENAFTFFTPIIGTRKRSAPDSKYEYWITDGLYGSFNCILYDAQKPRIKRLVMDETDTDSCETMHESVIWGSTCDSADMVSNDARLPANLSVDDWLMFEKFGAYTIAGACNFNGIEFTNPNMYYV